MELVTGKLVVVKYLRFDKNEFVLIRMKMGKLFDKLTSRQTASYVFKK